MGERIPQTGGSAVCRQNLSGVHDACRVESVLDAVHQLHFDAGADGGEFVTLQLAYAVLCGNGTAEGQYDAVDDCVHVTPAGDKVRFVGSDRLGYIVMNIAIAQMAKGADTCTGQGLQNGGVGLSQKLRDF